MKLKWRPARVPGRDVLPGDLVRLEPVDPALHAHSLFTASAEASRLWDYLGYGPFADEAEFTGWLERRAASDDPLFLAVVDLRSGRALGMASFMRMVPEHGVIEIGHIWFSPKLQRTRQATEAIYLMAHHVFDELGYRRLEWKCDALNEPSRRAADRFGFVYEGTFRQHMVVKGRNRDTAWFSMLDSEWPLAGSGFRAWLSPDNFDAEGHQRRTLAAIRQGLARS